MSLPDAAAIYDQVAEAYDRHARQSGHNAYCERPGTLSLLPDVAGNAVLDAGCGSGIYAEGFAAHGARVTGLDASPRMIDLARRNVPTGNFLRHDLRDPLPFPDGSFDLAVCALVLDHIGELVPVYRELYRVLIGGGVLACSFSHPFLDYRRPRPDYFAPGVLEAAFPNLGVTTPCFRRSLQDLLAPALAAGFVLTGLLEPRPLPEYRDLAPERYARLAAQPAFLCVRLQKGPF
jgi:ubiquinone/menaquinone biosynthesis C-methylase UbiE